MASKKNKKKSKSKPKKSLAKKTPKKKARSNKPAPKKKPAQKKRKAQGRTAPVEMAALTAGGQRAKSGLQSGDLQGLSDSAEVDSESVEDLLEEGNAFEAEVVEGVENASDADQGEVRTREVPEDDVPDEYLDKDQ